MTIETVPMLLLAALPPLSPLADGIRAADRTHPAAGSPVRAGDREGDDDDDDEKPASLADLPAVVKEAIRRVAGTNAIHEVEKATRAGVTTYEAEYRASGVEHSVTFSAAGEVILVEQEVSPATLPAEVKTAVGRKLPGGTIREAEAVYVGGAASPTYYELAVKDSRGKHELKVRPSGEILEDRR